MELSPKKPEDITGGEYSLFYGVTNYQVRAFNPTSAEREKITGYESKNEKTKSDYVKQLRYGDSPYTYPTFLLEYTPTEAEAARGLKPFFRDLEFQISDRFLTKNKEDGDSMHFFISDNFLRNPVIGIGSTPEEALQYIKDSGKYAWFIEGENIRPMYEGERELTLFMASLAGYKASDIKDNGVSFKNFSDLYKGKFKEIEEQLVKDEMKEGSVKCLTYIEKEKYMKVYNRYFINQAAPDNMFEKYLEYKPLRPHNGDYKITLQKYEPGTVQEAPKVENEATNSQWPEL